MITEQLRVQLEDSYEKGHRYLVVSRFAGTCYLTDHNEHNPATCYVVVLRDNVTDVMTEVFKWSRLSIQDNAPIDLVASYVDASLQNDGILATVLVARDTATNAEFIQVNLSPTNYSRLADRAKAVACRAMRHQTFYVNVM